jgi:predicted O-methyltransferase YrrM
MRISPVRQQEAAISGYQFTTDNFSDHIPVWECIELPHPCRVLEIGSHQGMSATWLLENKLKAGDEFHAVDAWQYEANGGQSLHEQLFDKNIDVALSKSPQVAFFKHKGLSRNVLSSLLSKGLAESFDMIYIDGSHEAPDVLEDLVLSNLLCKIDGLILCDDYLWASERPLTRTPKLAIDAFTNCFREKIDIIRDVPLYQIGLRKRKR